MSDRFSFLSRAAESLGFAGPLLPKVVWGGGAAPVVVAVDEEELQRREDVGLGAFEDYWVWELLVDLPYGEPVPWSEIDPVRRHAVDAVPHGLIESDGDSVARVIRPAVRPVLAIDEGPATKVVWAVSSFASVSHRAVVLEGRALKTGAAEAASHGIGVVIDEADTFRVLHRPLPPRRRDPFGYFRLCEKLLSLVLQDRAGRRAG